MSLLDRLLGRNLPSQQRRLTWLTAIAAVSIWTYYDYQKEAKKHSPKEQEWSLQDSQEHNKMVLQRQKEAKLAKEQRAAEGRAAALEHKQRMASLQQAELPAESPLR